jgi:NADH:ubiquinone oxidoreductase subunit H
LFLFSDYAFLENTKKKFEFFNKNYFDIFIQCFLYFISFNMNNALWVSFKFLSCIALLIFSRGGIPRFRFDYLTKLG